MAQPSTDIAEAGDDRALALLDMHIEMSDAIWVDEISAAATWPDPADMGSDAAYHDAMAKYDEYLIGPESRQISRILFQLRAFEVNSVARMEQLIERHNDSIAQDLADPEYSRQSGISAERLRQAMFSSESEKEVLLGNVARFGAGVLHKSAYGRLLVRHANVNRVNAALDILRSAGFVEIRKGANNADIVISDGRIEEAHRAYVDRIRAAVSEGELG